MENCYLGLFWDYEEKTFKRWREKKFSKTPAKRKTKNKAKT